MNLKMKWNYRDNGKRLYWNEFHFKTKKIEYINKEQAYYIYMNKISFLHNWIVIVYYFDFCFNVNYKYSKNTLTKSYIKIILRSSYIYFFKLFLLR